MGGAERADCDCGMRTECRAWEGNTVLRLGLGSGLGGHHCSLQEHQSGGGLSDTWLLLKDKEILIGQLSAHTNGKAQIFSPARLSKELSRTIRQAQPHHDGNGDAAPSSSTSLGRMGVSREPGAPCDNHSQCQCHRDGPAAAQIRAAPSLPGCQDALTRM